MSTAEAGPSVIPVVVLQLVHLDSFAVIERGRSECHHQGRCAPQTSGARGSVVCYSCCDKAERTKRCSAGRSSLAYDRWALVPKESAGAGMRQGVVVVEVQ